MRYPQGHKEAVRARIVESASRALRRRGLTGVSIPALMKEAGLTHGGFYSHFRDRDELLAEAVAFAGQETATRVLGPGTQNGQEMLRAYLSPEHATHPEHGCVLAALGTEGPHQGAKLRRTFGTTARGFIQLVHEKLHPRDRSERPSDDALETAARMIGGVLLARLVQDEELANRILVAARSA
jgi:TetR/AcrR family transcriptional regulator, transcriptional repressor for nem operon